MNSSGNFNEYWCIHRFRGYLWYLVRARCIWAFHVFSPVLLPAVLKSVCRCLQPKSLIMSELMVVRNIRELIIIHIFPHIIDSIRGQLSTIYHHTRNFGILFAYTLGSSYNYIVSSMIYTGITILFFVTFLLIPATPQYLLQKNNTEVRSIPMIHEYETASHLRKLTLPGRWKSIQVL